MHGLFTVRRIILSGFLVLLTLLPIQAQPPKDLSWTHAFDLASRKFGEDSFTDKTQKFGMEVFRDNNNSLGLYVSETGSIALGQGFDGLKLPLDSKGPEWLTGLDLQARKAGELEFTRTTKVYALEIFKDPHTTNWLYITEMGQIAAAPSTGKSSGKSAKFSHSMDLKVRKAGTDDWAKAEKFGIEVYRDSNTGSLIYLAENGSLAVVPETEEPKAGKDPVWLHSLELKSRKPNESSFTQDTRKYNVELYRDESTGNLIFLSETGSIAVAPGGGSLKAPTEKAKDPAWTHGLNVLARSYGEKEFSEKTRVHAAEVFRDENVGVVLYISDAGKIAALRK